MVIMKEKFTDHASVAPNTRSTCTCQNKSKVHCCVLPHKLIISTTEEMLKMYI